MVFRGLGLRFGPALLTVVAEQGGSQFVEEGLDLPSMAQGSLEHGRQFLGDIHAAALAALGEAEDVSRVFVPPGARLAVGAEARFSHLSHGALDGRPELGDLVEEKLLRIRKIGSRNAAHVYGIRYRIPSCSKKRQQNALRPNESLHYRLRRLRDYRIVDFND
jgi:hypothetical protein